MVLGSFSGLVRLMVISRSPYWVGVTHLMFLAICAVRMLLESIHSL